MPSAVAMSVDDEGDHEAQAATASGSPSTPSGFSQYLSVNPCHTTLLLPAGLLKLNRMISATGSIR